MKAKFFLLALGLFFACETYAASNFAAPRPSTPYTVTISSVSLQDVIGEWRVILSPDRRVDLSVEEPSVVFFNNGGRVPRGQYQNFKVLFLDQTNSQRTLTLQKSLDKKVNIEPGAYIRVAFDLDTKGPMRLIGAKLVADEDERAFSENELKLTNAISEGQ